DGSSCKCSIIELSDSGHEACAVDSHPLLLSGTDLVMTCQGSAIPSPEPEEPEDRGLRLTPVLGSVPGEGEEGEDADDSGRRQLSWAWWDWMFGKGRPSDGGAAASAASGGGLALSPDSTAALPEAEPSPGPASASASVSGSGSVSVDSWDDPDGEFTDSDGAVRVSAQPGQDDESEASDRRHFFLWDLWDWAFGRSNSKKRRDGVFCFNRIQPYPLALSS
ncbi:unnamed protein product, partial [Chrysoparadoxa australica]